MVTAVASRIEKVCLHGDPAPIDTVEEGIGPLLALAQFAPAGTYLDVTVEPWLSIPTRSARYNVRNARPRLVKVIIIGADWPFHMLFRGYFRQQRAMIEQLSARQPRFTTCIVRRVRMCWRWCWCRSRRSYYGCRLIITAICLSFCAPSPFNAARAHQDKIQAHVHWFTIRHIVCYFGGLGGLARLLGPW